MSAIPPLLGPKGAAKLRIGDLVTTDFIASERRIIRAVLRVERADKCETGYRVTLSGGPVCSHCGKPQGTPICGVYGYGISAAWCRLAKQ